jgi:hypothetical protein
MNRKRRHHYLPPDEEAIAREKRRDEVEHLRETRHPHEKLRPVGEDQREYITEELKEQGYTDEGLIQREEDEEERPNPQIKRARKAA